MKAFKRYSAARAAANGQPILRVTAQGETLFIVGLTIEDGAVDDISLIDGMGYVTANISPKHFDRLGNANWAEPRNQGIVYRGNRPRIWPPIPEEVQS